MTPYVGGFGSGIRRFKTLDAVICIYGRHKSALAGIRISGVRIKDLLKIIGGRGLTLGAGYRESGQICLRIAVEHTSDKCHRTADIVYGNISFLLCNDLIAEIRNCTLLYRGEKVFFLKMNALGNKESTGSNLAGIKRELGYLCICVIARNIRAHQHTGIIKCFDKISYSINLIYHIHNFLFKIN